MRRLRIGGLAVATVSALAACSSAHPTALGSPSPTPSTAVSAVHTTALAPHASPSAPRRRRPSAPPTPTASTTLRAPPRTSAPPAPGTTSPASSGPNSLAAIGAPGCVSLAANNILSTSVAGLPVDSHNAAWKASTDASGDNLHPDFGPSFGAQPVPYGIPWQVVPDSARKVQVSFQYASESDPGPYPLGPGTPIEGGQNASGDRHALVIDAGTCTLYETWDTHYAASGSTAGSGAIFHLGSDVLRPAGWTSADAAGLPIFPLLVRWDEVQAGHVDHAIRFTVDATDASYLWPARHEAGSANANLPPMGARARLRANFPLGHYSRDAQVILRAMQTYGIVVADNGSNWYFQGDDATGWPDSLISELKTIPAADFDFVNTASLEINPNSAAAR